MLIRRASQQTDGDREKRYRERGGFSAGGSERLSKRTDRKREALCSRTRHPQKEGPMAKSKDLSGMKFG